MTNEQMSLLYQQELELLAGWINFRDVMQNRKGGTEWSRLAAIDGKIVECNARLDKLEIMGAKPCTRQNAS